MIKLLYLSGALFLNSDTVNEADTPATAIQKLEHLPGNNSLVYDFGIVKKDISSSRIFKIYNNTTKVIRIRTIWPSIYGTVTAWTKKPVKPGKAALMKVVYNAIQPGPFEMNLKVVYYNPEILKGESLTEDIVVKGVAD